MLIACLITVHILLNYCTWPLICIENLCVCWGGGGVSERTRYFYTEAAVVNFMTVICQQSKIMILLYSSSKIILLV